MHLIVHHHTFDVIPITKAGTKAAISRLYSIVSLQSIKILLFSPNLDANYKNEHRCNRVKKFIQQKVDMTIDQLFIYDSRVVVYVLGTFILQILSNLYNILDSVL